MDGVIADVERHALNYYRQETGIVLTTQDILGHSESDVLPEGRFRKYVLTAGFFDSAPIMEGAVEAVRQLMETYEVYVVSAAMEFPLSLTEKKAWLSQHFPFIGWKNIVFCGDKSIIHTDYMIDDHGKNLDFHRGKTLMFSSFHNHGQSKHPRVDNWQGVLEWFEKEG